MVGTATAVWAAGPAAHAASHLVRPGDTLSDIAARYGVTVASIARRNDIEDPNFIVAGHRLRIPGRARPTATHVVQSGETLSELASRYRTSVRRLARRNHLADPNLIVAGSRLKVPAPLGAPAPAPVASVESSLEHHSATHGLDAHLVKAVAWQESGWQQGVVSSAGAIGVMQVMPGTARYVNRSLGGGSLKVRQADDNVHLGVMYLRHMLRIMRGERRALAAYYSGPGNVGRKLKRYQKTYVRSVTALKRRF